MTRESPADCRETEGARKINLLGLPISLKGIDVPSDLDSATKANEPFIATFLNPYSYYVAEHDPGFVQDLSEFDRISCDGIALVVATKLCLNKKIPRQAFDTTSLAIPVFRWAESLGKRTIIVGGRTGVAESAAIQLKKLVPGLIVAGTFSGFGKDPGRAIQSAEEHSDSLVVAGMGAPIQEKFLISLKNSQWRGVGFTCGGFLDQINERINYYPEWINTMNLRFIYRFIKEPHRLWRRYLIEYQVFVGRFLKALVSR